MLTDRQPIEHPILNRAVFRDALQQVVQQYVVASEPQYTICIYCGKVDKHNRESCVSCGAPLPMPRRVSFFQDELQPFDDFFSGFKKSNVTYGK